MTFVAEDVTVVVFGFGVCWFDVLDVVETFVVDEVTVVVFGLVDF